MNYVKDKYKIVSNYVIEIIVVTGILKWEYELQVYIGN